MSMPDLNSGLIGLLGMEFTELGPDRVTLRWEVDPTHYQPLGLLHGGVHCAAVESAASVGAALWLAGTGHVVGVSNQTDFLRPVSEGTLTATATPVHRGRRQQLWVAEIRDEEERLVARGQVRLQNLVEAERAGPAPG